MERQAAPGAAETISHIALETYRRTTPAIPFRVLRIIERSIKILE